MKIYNTFFAWFLAAILMLPGCTEERLKDGGKVTLHISAVIPTIMDSAVTRADNTTSNSFKVALSTTVGAYPGIAQEYTASISGGGFQFAPVTDPLVIALLQTSTPLTIYGEKDDIPYYYTNATTTVSRGIVSNINLTYAYAKVAVRVLKAGTTETAKSYTVSSDVLMLPEKEANGSYKWQTSEATPQLIKGSVPTSTKNTNKTSASALTFMDAEECMAVAPSIVAGNTSKLFTLTNTATNKSFTVASLANGLTFEAGKAYLFTVDLDKEATLTVTSITTMGQEEVDYRTTPGIYTYQDLKNFRDTWNTEGEAGFAADKYFKWGDKGTKTIRLLTNIDLNNEEWTPINDFTGIFEGGNHNVSNLVVTASRNSGFFSSVKNSASTTSSSIQNLTIENAQVTGTVCGVLSGSVSNSTISNCSASGTLVVNAQNVGAAAGGLVGECSGSLVERCTVSGSGTGSSITSASAAGGICGKGSNTTNIVACTASNFSSIAANDANSGGTIIGTGDSDASVYGCVAYNIEALTGTSFGNVTTANNNYFCNVYGLGSSLDGYTPYLESLNTYTAYLNVGLLAFNQKGGDQMAYIYKGSYTPGSTGPILVSGTPATLPDDANFETRAPGIYTAHELVAFAAATTKNETTELAKYQNNGTVNIIKAIDMDRIAYTPCDISSGITVQGYNGQQTISNLSGAPALFGKVSGTIKDVIMKDVNLIGENCAAFARTGTPTIEYCKVIGGTITSTGDIVFGNNLSNNNAGGIAAYPTNATITACTVQDLKINGPRIGGIIGTNTGGNCNIYSCAVINSSFTTTANNIWNGAGGIIGRQTHGNNNKHITSCFLYGVRGAKAIFIGSYTSSNWFYMDHNYWADMGGTTKDVSNTGNDTWQVTDCSLMTDLSETITNLNNKVATGYEWQTVLGQDYPSIVKQ